MEKTRNSKIIIDATLAFQEERILALYEKIYGQEMHSKDDLSKAMEVVETVSSLDFQGFSSGIKEKFQSLCGRLHQMQADEIVDRIFDATQDLRRNGIKSLRDVESLQKAITDFSHQYRGLSEMNAILLKKASMALELLCADRKKKGLSNAFLSQSRQTKICEKEDVALAVELLDLAGCLYKQKQEKYIDRDLLRKIAFFSRKMNLPSITQTSGRKEILLFIQAMVIKSFEIARRDGYIPSKQEILEILEEGACLS